jgi:hypothetical protein
MSFARRHVRLREEGWPRGLIVNGFGAVLLFVVEVVVAVIKFSHGAWVVTASVPGDRSVAPLLGQVHDRGHRVGAGRVALRLRESSMVTSSWF